MRIERDETAALVIDIQERLFPFIHEHDILAKNAGILIKGMQALEIPLLLTQQYTKGLGPTIEALSGLLPGTEPIEKMAFSCCDEPKFDIELELLSKKYIIITGIETHVCVLQTAVDLLERGYIPVIVEDCVSSRSLNDKKTAIRRMHKEGALITTYESVLFELLRYSGTDEFREISKLVK
jgi:nicotinamidase-related amidase